MSQEQKPLKELQRQLEIEAALERVRDRSMTMHSTDELQEVLNTVYAQFLALNVDISGGAFLVINEDIDSDIVCWGAGGSADYVRQVRLPFMDMPIYTELMDGIKKRTAFFRESFSYEEKQDFFKELFKNPPYNKSSAARKKEVLSRPGGYTRSCVVSENTSIFIINHHGRDFTAEENEILRRIGKVFEQTYVRFLDLQKAEAQAREAQVEAALERVRSSSMAMHKSEELKEVIRVIFDQLALLDINAEHAGIVVDYEPKKDFHFWVADNQDIPARITVPYLDLVWDRQFTKAKNRGEDFFTTQLDFEEKNSFYKKLLPHIEGLTKEAADYYLSCPGLAASTVIQKDIGLYIENFSGIPFSDEENAILMRLGKVFQQTYTRFLDIKKVEQQTREANIETALERVRAASMAMHESDELYKVISIISEQLDYLGIDMDAAMINEKVEGSKDWYLWLAVTSHRAKGYNRIDQVHVPYTRIAAFDRIYRSIEEGKSWFSDQLTKAQKDLFFRHYFKNSNHRDVPQERQKYILMSPGMSRTTILSKNSFIQFFRYSDQVFSEEENLILSRLGNVFEQSHTRFLDLQKAEKQAREAEIETALERVRSKTMAMHNSQDVSDTVITLFQEVMKLGLDESIRCGIGILEGNEDMETWSANADQQGAVNLKMGMLNMTIHPMLKGLKKAWEKGEKGYSYHFEGADVIRYYTALNNEPEYPLHMDLSKLPDNQFAKTFLFTEGILFAFTKTPLSEEAIRVLGRFADVFGQTYRRYLDLLKAEAQAREAQIEAALERVRAGTMAMHNSEDIADTVATFFEELLGLGLGNSTRCGIGILSPSEVMKVWTASIKNISEIALHSGSLQMRGHPLLKGVQKAWSEEESLLEYTLEGADKLRYFQVINEAPDYPVKIALDNLTNSIYHYSFVFPQGVLFVFAEAPLKEEIRDIFTRFASVFGQTYTRFLDLERAEARAQESKIEAALERVRAKAMAMHSSEDLRQTITAVFEELKHLNVRPFRMGLGLLNPDKPEGEIIASFIDDNDQIIEVSGIVKLDVHPVLERIYDHWKKGVDHFPLLQGDEINSYYATLGQSIELQGHGTDIRHYGCFLPFKEGGIYAWAWQPHTDEQIGILKKFTSVVEITYRRYKDLVEAEAREVEAIKQASLDRVRAEIASMRTTEDLKRITPLVWKELTTLGIPFFRCGVFIMDETTQMVHVYLTTPAGEALAAMDLPFDFEVSLIQQGVEYWREQKTFIEEWDQKQFVEMTTKLMEQGQVKNIKTYQAGEKPPKYLVLHQVPFAQGMLYVGNTEPLSGTELDVVKALTRTFAVAYARYEDFKELEKAKKKVENTLDDLKAAQSQLIQSEKMASLGELTAGIAHEIKNPLNFVNNFSDVSKELLEELLEELRNGEMEEVEALAKDIIQNLEKIVHHGHRADSIVKGMLQHSRSGDGKKEPTDLNALADEYLRLAYHGLRAKDKSFNAVINTDFDPTMGSVDLIPQDMGRVILNLLTNAFYAVNEKSSAGKASENGSYEPTVTVKTKRLNDLMEISVSDNGGGIPKKVLDKIFQPFFTTKPTGQGTGLGLSLSYDIVKAHGGELSAETEEGKGTTFFIKFKSKS